MNEVQIILFAGTTEGRLLGERLSREGTNVLLCVATEYGEELVASQENLVVHTGRMDSEEMAQLMKKSGCRLVVDATHPYAREVTANIKGACQLSGARYLRVIRDAWEDAAVVTAADAREAADILTREGGRALLTVGSKELEAFTAVPDYQNRLYARILPMADAMEKCVALGFSAHRLICMQGPFSHDLNAALLRQVKADWLVTKDSGETGGFHQKLSASRETGARMLLIRRPEQGDGLCYQDALHLLLRELGLKNSKAYTKPSFPRFPLFIDLADQPVVLVGGGKVASRRAETLRRCGGNVTVIAPEIKPELAGLADRGLLQWVKKTYTPGDLAQYHAVVVVAVTDNRAVNRQVGQEAMDLGIPCSVADAPREGSFWFPAFVYQNSLAAGIVSTSGDHRAVRRAALQLRREWGAEE